MRTSPIRGSGEDPRRGLIACECQILDYDNNSVFHPIFSDVYKSRQRIYSLGADPMRGGQRPRES